MKSRIITGIIGIALLLVVLVLPPIAITVAVSLICAMAMYELLIATHFKMHRSIFVTSVIFAASVPFFYLFNSYLPILIILFVYISEMVCIQIITYKTQSIECISFAFLMSLIFPVAFSCLAYLRIFSVRHGLFYVIIAIIMPWMCDMGAYFVGTFFGRHKLCPNISPKKTVEGLVGGLIISVLSSVAAGMIYQYYFLKDTATVVLWQLAIVAFICALLSVPGDLFASLIKRQNSVKDFGSIMPGHGGILDRFDSMLLSVPFFYLLVHYLPLIV
ncbi:MAG: phosphatidate cytidylyltransferase [Oscillospiraceae bacterium]|nr:phosphatidate cytidylyltransferase [Oscillospiraceae bacterium]MDD4414152.1 phosphatidate cytidylyltransferase [Oscillospiraceae bacterium]